MRIELELYGKIPTVKDSYLPVMRKGKPALTKDRKLTAKLNYILEQIPREYWDLRLKHPEIIMQRFAPPENQRRDRDGMLTTILDLLVRAGILVDDSDLYNNGDWHILKTQIIEGTPQKVLLILETAE